MKNHRRYFVYMIECQNGAFYTGYTTDLTRRFKEHQAGHRNSKYTRAHGVRYLRAYWQIFASLSQTLRLERAVKQLKRTRKIDLIRHPRNIAPLIIDLGYSVSFIESKLTCDSYS